MPLATPAPMTRPTMGMPASKTPKISATRTRARAVTPPKPMPIAAARVDRPTEAATRRRASARSGSRRVPVCPGAGSGARLLQFDPVPRRVLEERLASAADLDRLGDRDPQAPQVSDGRVGGGPRQGEMLAHRRGHIRLDQVDLLAPGIQPGPAEAEVRPVGALGQAEHAGVKVQRRRDVTDVERDMVQPVWSHEPSLAAGGSGGQSGRGRDQPAVGSVTRPRNSGRPLSVSVMANRNGRSTIISTGGSVFMNRADALMITAVAAAASVPSSLTSI